ncbi:MAG: DoxX family protein, partial [Acidobacteriota bacterium]
MESIHPRILDFIGSAPELDAFWAPALLLLRVYFGTVILFVHGLPKLKEVVAGQGHFLELVRGLGFPRPALFAGFAAVAQVGGGVLIIVGLWTRPAALIVASTIAFGVLAVHWRDGFKVMETGLAYSMVLIAIATAGPGWISWDQGFSPESARAVESAAASAGDAAAPLEAMAHAQAE